MNPLATLVLALLFGLAIPGAGQAQGIEELVEGMTEPGWNINLYRELRKRRDPACIPQLVQAAPHMDGRGQHMAVLLLELFPPEKAEAAFSRLLKVESPELCFLAGRYLGQRGRPGMVQVMLAALSDPALTDDRKGAILTRIRDGAPHAINLAVAAWIDVQMAPSLANTILRHLLNTRDGSCATAVERLLAHEDRGTQLRAAAFLLRFGSKAANETLQSLLKAEEAKATDWRVMKEYLMALPRLPSRLQSILVEQLEDANKPARLKALLEVVRDHELPGAADRLVELLDHDDEKTRRIAFNTLDWQGNWKAQELLPLLTVDDLLLRVKAADALRRSDDLTGLPVLIEIASTAGPQREEACRVLAACRLPESVEPLISALESKDRKVREAASGGLESVLWSLYPYRRFDLASTGYDAAKKPAATVDAVATLHSWWQRHRDADW